MALPPESEYRWKKLQKVEFMNRRHDFQPLEVMGLKTRFPLTDTVAIHAAMAACPGNAFGTSAG